MTFRSNDNLLSIEYSSASSAKLTASWQEIAKAQHTAASDYYSLGLYGHAEKMQKEAKQSADIARFRLMMLIHLR